MRWYPYPSLNPQYFLQAFRDTCFNAEIISVSLLQSSERYIEDDLSIQIVYLADNLYKVIWLLIYKIKQQIKYHNLEKWSWIITRKVHPKTQKKYSDCFDPETNIDAKTDSLTNVFLSMINFC